MGQILKFCAESIIINVTLYGISGNKVNARTKHANGMTRLPCKYAHKNN